ncbi:MAG: ABC transporter ATP-binding protein [Actinobacteria bacterium]|nr:ABC transporter ATP-binding protein [Actinomycetota bacterium]
MSGPILSVEDLVAGYRPGVDIVRGVDLRIEQGEMVVVIGPNGAGKSTLIKCLCGLVEVRRGRISIAGEDVTGSKPHAIARRGVGYVPQRENIFPRLTVEENLEVGAMPFPGVEIGPAKERIFALFPRLAERRRQPAEILSGGERQMLAMARALIPAPHLLLLDEPSAGVDPGVVEIVWEKIEEVREAGATVLMVEQNARRALGMADRGYVLDLGQARFEGTGVELLSDPAIAELYLGGRPRDVDAAADEH